VKKNTQKYVLQIKMNKLYILFHIKKYVRYEILKNYKYKYLKHHSEGNRNRKEIHKK